MRSVVRVLLLLIGSAVACLAQTAKAELGLNYNWMYSNFPQGGNSTFSMNGGSASLAWNLNRTWAVVGDVGAVHGANVPIAGQGLTMTSYVVGPRYYYRRKSIRERQFFTLTPYGQLLLGGAHASGSLAGNIGGSSNAFAMKVGGGVELPLNRTVVLRPAQMEYLLTRFPNGGNDRQNNFEFGVGVSFRLGQH
jgi:peptidoglycan-associated lipoprotein